MWGGGIAIIGLNVSQDDFVVESLFRYLFRACFSDKPCIRLLNPDRKVKQRFLDLSGGIKMDFVQEKFSEETLALALLRE